MMWRFHFISFVENHLIFHVLDSFSLKSKFTFCIPSKPKYHSHFRSIVVLWLGWGKLILSTVNFPHSWTKKKNSSKIEWNFPQFCSGSRVPWDQCQFNKNEEVMYFDFPLALKLDPFCSIPAVLFFFFWNVCCFCCSIP